MKNPNVDYISVKQYISIEHFIFIAPIYRYIGIIIMYGICPFIILFIGTEQNILFLLFRRWMLNDII